MFAWVFFGEANHFFNTLTGVSIMSNQTPNRPGQIAGSGAVDALFLRQFSGEVLTAFETATVTKGRVRERTITNGKSAQFPVTGRATAFYHTPGNEILGGAIRHAERTITVNQLLISPVFIADIDEAMNHYDVRSIYSNEVGKALAYQMDRHNFQVGILAARSTAALAELQGGTVITEATAGDFLDGDALAAAFYLAAQRLDEKDVPSEGRVAFLPPAQYYAMIQSEKAVNRDYGGNGDFARGKIWSVAGIDIVMTNHLPSTNVTAGSVAAGSENGYVGDFTKVRGLIMHPEAIGVLKLMDLSTRMDYDPRRLGHQVVAKYAIGHGVLRPDCAVELRAF